METLGLRTKLIVLWIVLSILTYGSNVLAGSLVIPYTLPTGTTNQAYSADLSTLARPATYGSTSFSRYTGTLLRGLTFANVASIISGTPTVSGTYTNVYQVYALNGSYGYNSCIYLLSFNFVSSSNTGSTTSLLSLLSSGMTTRITNLANGAELTGGTVTFLTGDSSALFLSLNEQGAIFSIPPQGDGSLSGPLSGVGGVTISGSGGIIMSGANTSRVARPSPRGLYLCWVNHPLASVMCLWPAAAHSWERARSTVA